MPRDEFIRKIQTEIDRLDPVDWVGIINDMSKDGMSLRKIAEAVGVSLSTLQGWQCGSMPGYEYGRRLLVLQARMAGITVEISTR